jgi:hypothetical protein
VSAAQTLPPSCNLTTLRRHAAKLREAGADQACVVNSEAGLNLGSALLADLGTPETDISLLRRGIHEALAVRTAAALPKRNSGSASIDSGEALVSLSSIDSDSAGDGKGMAHAMSLGASMDAHGGSSGVGEQGKKKKKPEKETVELFVLDGRMSYGFSMLDSRPVSADVVERPCSDCPLLQNSALLDQPVTAPTAVSVNGGGVSSSGAEPLGNGNSLPAAAAPEAVSAASSAPNHTGSL